MYYTISEGWQKINGEVPVCFGAKDNEYGAFNMTKSGRVKTMKLIHRSGSVHCNPTTGASYWGCTHSRYQGDLTTIITDVDKKPVLPPAHDLKYFGGPDEKAHFTVFLDIIISQLSSFFVPSSIHCLFRTIKRCRFGTDRIWWIVTKGTTVGKLVLMYMHYMCEFAH